MDPLEAREDLNAYILGLETKIEPVPNIRDSSIPSTGYEIPIRIYTPEGDGPFPVLIFIHGAGWVAGNLDTHDNVCRCLCARVKCGEAFGRRLRDAGVSVNVYCQEGKGHLAGDFARATEDASEAVDLSVAALREVFRSS